SLIGLSFSCEPHSGYYVPLPDDREETIGILEEFRPVFEDPRIEKVGHNLKFDLSVFRWHGIGVRGELFDTMLAAHLAVPDLRRTMDYLAQSLLGYRPIPISDLIGERGPEQPSLRDADRGKVAEYSAEDADITLQLREVLRPLVAEKNQERVFSEVECPLIPVLVDMEYEGIRVDVDVLHGLSRGLEKEIETTAERIYELAGERLNLNSAQQLGALFFEKLNLDPNARRTQKSRQYQTNEQVLNRLAQRHEIASQVLHYRLCSKLKSTYLDMLPGAVFPATRRVHTNYEQAVTVTGRMQSHNPNLQTIPIRSEEGREIRKAFVSRDDSHTLLSADYSQIELRVAAELSGDEAMLETFRSGGDIHTATAVRIYGLQEAEVTQEMRRQAKTVNFGIIYGISPFGLAERLDISRTQASELIEQYFAQYPGARRYMEETIAFARKNGFVQTAMGRRRYLRDINSRNATTRQAAERNAINAPIQGTAADMIKIAMVNIHRELLKRKLRSRMLLQVHDELVFDMHKDEIEDVPPMVEWAMRTAIPMKVPIVVEMGLGHNWLDAH
ncbi:MAG: DNA polymerase I, partial [Verrucomicrobia bacterium RIFCSPLOWO2_12_FULL_64_8]